MGLGTVASTYRLLGEVAVFLVARVWAYSPYTVLFFMSFTVKG